MKTVSKSPLVRRWIPSLLLAVGALGALRHTLADAAQALPLMERQKEIALALSACPASIAEKAAVYVLESSGYVKVRDSQNGFTALVQHSLPTSQEPQCMDAEGARSFLQRMLKVAELRASSNCGVATRQLHMSISKRRRVSPATQWSGDFSKPESRRAKDAR